MYIIPFQDGSVSVGRTFGGAYSYPIQVGADCLTTTILSATTTVHLGTQKWHIGGARYPAASCCTTRPVRANFAIAAKHLARRQTRPDASSSCERRTTCTSNFFDVPVLFTLIANTGTSTFKKLLRPLAAVATAGQATA